MMSDKFWKGLADSIGAKIAGIGAPMVKTAAAAQAAPVEIVPVPDSIPLREAKGAGFFKLARNMGWGLYRVEDIDGGLGSIWSIEKAADGSQFLVKQTDPEGEVMRLKTASAEPRKKDQWGRDIPTEQEANEANDRIKKMFSPDPKDPGKQTATFDVPAGGSDVEVTEVNGRKPKTAKIVKEDGGYEVQSEEGKNLGDEKTKGEAEKRLHQVEYFKHHKGSEVQRVRVAAALDSGEPSTYWHLNWGGAGQPACGKTTQDGYRVAVDEKDVNCPRCLDIASRSHRLASTPPGKEKVVKELKKKPGVENPWAVAWSQYDKEKKAAGTHTKCVKCDAQGEVAKMEKNQHGAGFLCAGCAKEWNKEAAVSGLSVKAEFLAAVEAADVRI